jgi:tetratricopeptide (TPR) repeat protein
MSTENNEILEKAKGFWANYSKKITYIGSAIILLAVGWIGYQKLIKEPKELKAAESIFLAEDLFDKMSNSGFNKDSVNIVLNGGTFDGANITGLLKIINNNDGTENANRAKYMVGACYLQIKEYEKAIKFLKEFNGNGADQIQSKAYTMLGHAYAEQNKKDEAMEYYTKAANVNEKDDSFTPDALVLCGNYADAIGKTKEAIEFFKKVKENYPANAAVTSGEVDKRLARLGEFN